MRFVYCPLCSSKLVSKKIGDEGMMPYCERCSVPWWDTFTTGIITAVVNEYEEVALLRQNYVSADTYVCVAGIMKTGESAEETVIREVKEEIGQDVETVEYIGSYPHEKKEMLMLGYKSTVKKQDFITSDEVDAVEWFKFDRALSYIREGSIAYRLVKAVIEKHSEQKALNQLNN